MSTYTLGAGTLMFPDGKVVACESLTVTFNGREVTDCEIDFPRGAVSFPMTIAGEGEGQFTVGPSCRRFAQPKIKRTAAWKQQVYGPKRRKL